MISILDVEEKNEMYDYEELNMTFEFVNVLIIIKGQWYKDVQLQLR